MPYEFKWPKYPPLITAYNFYTECLDTYMVYIYTEYILRELGTWILSMGPLKF